MRSGLNVLKTSTFRLVIIYLAVFALSVGAVLAYVYWNTALLIERQLTDTVRTEFQALTREYRDAGMEGVRRSAPRATDVGLQERPEGHPDPHGSGWDGA